MVHRILWRAALAGALASAASSDSCQAAMLRFDDPTSYQVNKGDSYSFPAVIGNSLYLTSGYDQTRSIWFKAPQSISQPFTATFKYRLASISGQVFGQGLTFAIQNSPAGLNAISPQSLRHLGYEGVARSISVSIEVSDSTTSTRVGSYTNGAVGIGGAISASPIDARQGRALDVTVAYDGSRLSATMVDGPQAFGPIHFNVGSLNTLLGSTTAYVGFTANTYGGPFSTNGATQIISDVSFQPVPEPTCLLLAPSLIVAARLRRRAAIRKSR